MLVEVRHFFPGRVRLYVPGVFGSSEVPEQIVQRMLASGAARRIRANRHCASIVVEYDHGRPGIVADLINRLRRASSVEALNSPGAVIGVTVSPAVPTRREMRPRFPLTLPSASLLLSFFTGPAVVAVNVPLMLWNSRPIGRRAWRVVTHERRL